MSLHPSYRDVVRLLIIGLMALAASPAAAQTERMYFPAVESVTNVLVQRINAEAERIDMSAWYLTEGAIVQALINRHRAGIPVRLIGDRGSIFEIDAHTRNAFYELAAAGVPIRLRYNPTWFPEIAHWKATIFAGQGVVAFGSANYTPFELAPVSSTNYKDETILFTNDIELVRAFKTKFDRFWNDTTSEAESKISGPPYFRNWNDACAAESACSDYWTRYPNRAQMFIDTSRLEQDWPTSVGGNMIWGQGPSFNNRLVQEINDEFTRVDFVIYRLTVNNITQALLSKHQSGVPVRLIIEPSEYRNKKWPEFWLTRANIDRLWAAGVPVKWRIHDGLTHMKMLVTSDYATNASSNLAANWQRDHNYFVPAATKPAIYGAMRDRFQGMWTNTVGFANFVPEPPDAAGLVSPGNGSTGVPTTATLTWNRAAFATGYDVYVGTSSSNMTRRNDLPVPAQLVQDPPTTYSFTASLQAGTTYFWQVVSRTNATPRNPALVAPSSIRSFTTSGTATPPPSSSLPSPWANQDIGTATGGSAGLSGGVYTVRGAGSDIWGSADSFHFAYQPLSGDGQIVARVTGVQNTNTYAKAGIMMRAGTAAGAAHVILDLRPNGAVEFMTRTSAGGSTSWLGGATQPAPAWLRLQRSGSTATAAVSSNGSTWTTVGTTTFTSSTVNAGLAVTSHATGTLNTSTFDNVSVSAGGTAPPPPPPTTASDIVVYASDIPASALHGSWSSGADSSSPNGVKLLTTDAGFVTANQPLTSPADYVDVTVNAEANVPYRIWLRLRALNNSKVNDAVWVQFSNARVNGSQVYGLNSTSGLLVNLATDGTATSLNNWGWQNGAYWLSQATAVTFPVAGSQTIRIQVREDGVQLDQIVLSPSRFFNSPPGGVSNDTTIVPK